MARQNYFQRGKSPDQKWIEERKKIYPSFWSGNASANLCSRPTGACIFQHHNLHTWSQDVMICTFSRPNVLFTTAAGNFALIVPLTTWLGTRHCNRRTFRLTQHTNHEKKRLYHFLADFPTTASSVAWLDYSAAVLFIGFSTLHISRTFYRNFLPLIWIWIS